MLGDYMAKTVQLLDKRAREAKKQSVYKEETDVWLDAHASTHQIGGNDELDVSDGMIGTRKLDDTSPASSDTGYIQVLLDGIATRLRQIMGETNWYDAPIESLRKTVVTKTADYTVLTSDSVIICNATTTITLTLPTAVGYSGKSYVIKNINIGSVVIDGLTTETIDGQLTITINNQWTSLTIVSNGTSWYII